MFRNLSTEESQQVKKWQAPKLGVDDPNVNPLKNMLAQSLDDEEPSATDIDDLKNIVRDAQENASASNDAFVGSALQTEEEQRTHASLAMTNPSAGMLQQTYDEGFNAGLAEGQSKAVEGETAKLNKLFKEIESKQNQFDVAIEKEIILLAKAMAKLILLREIETDDTAMQSIVQNAIQQLPLTSMALTVVLHPTDLSIVESSQSLGDAIIFKSDITLTRGDCRIEYGKSSLVAGIDALVNSIASSTSFVSDDIDQESASDDSSAED